MSPRAAWRLEALGFTEVYDYVGGKADWRAAGLATERREPGPPRAIEVMSRDVPTCTPDERVVDVIGRLGQSAAPALLVVNASNVVQGRLRPGRVDPEDTRLAGEVMEVGPPTIRADADVAETRERMRKRHVSHLLVSTPDGVLLGVLELPASDGR